MKKTVFSLFVVFLLCNCSYTAISIKLPELPDLKTSFTLLTGKYSSSTITYNTIGAVKYQKEIEEGIKAWAIANKTLNFVKLKSVNAQILFIGNDYDDKDWNAVCTNTPSIGWRNNSLISLNYTNMDKKDSWHRQGTITHELGHALGLDHVMDKNQIMFPFDDRYTNLPNFGDILGVNLLYP